MGECGRIVSMALLGVAVASSARAEPSPERQEELLYRLRPLIDANFVETNPAPVKAALHAMGRIENVLRLPLVPVTDATRWTVLAALRTAGVEPAHV